jgi:hypothetical protein
MDLAHLAQERAVGIQHGSSVEVHAVLRFLVHGEHHGHAVLSCQRRHALGDRPGYRLCRGIPLRILLCGKIRAVEDLLQAEDLHAFLPRFLHEPDVFLDHRFLDLGYRAFVPGVRCLDVGAAYNAGHGGLLSSLE